VLPTRNKRAKNTRALGLEHLSSALADGLNRPEQGLPSFYLSRDSTISSMQSNKPSKKAPNIAAQTVTAAPETNTAAEVTAEPRGEDVPSREGAHEERAKVTHSHGISWLAADSTSPGERPIVLFNTGAINYVEIRSRLADNEQCRVVFTNGSEYLLQDAERAGNFLRQLREQGIWQTVEAAKTAEPSPVATAAEA
jgi:hypothetical protein